jgi:hypothetical protein
LHRRAALEHGDATRSVSQARLESNHAVACQAFICSADLTSYKIFTILADKMAEMEERLVAVEKTRKS